MTISRTMAIVAVAALAILVIGGAAFAFATNGNTYTGCLDPGGTIIHVAIGDQPAKECAPSHTQISWNETGPAGAPGADGADGQDGLDGADGADGQDGADGVSGYEKIQKNVKKFDPPLPAGEREDVRVYCPAGKKPLGGGYQFLFPTTIVMRDAPITAGELHGWSVNFYNGSDVDQEELLRVWVICATVLD